MRGAEKDVDHVLSTAQLCVLVEQEGGDKEGGKEEGGKEGGRKEGRGKEGGGKEGKEEEEEGGGGGEGGRREREGAVRNKMEKHVWREWKKEREERRNGREERMNARNYVAKTEVEKDATGCTSFSSSSSSSSSTMQTSRLPLQALTIPPPPPPPPPLSVKKTSTPLSTCAPQWRVPWPLDSCFGGSTKKETIRVLDADGRISAAFAAHSLKTASTTLDSSLPPFGMYT